MNKNNTEEPQSVTVSIDGSKIELNAEQVAVLEQLAEDDWAMVRDMVSFGDAVVTALAVGDQYCPSDKGAAAAVRVVTNMKQLLNSLIGERSYGQFQ
ncbi:MAG: hypothetical protein IJ754_08010 [Bacteroidaceae bacterium]|nr:hypothetical protein [Bacteroidaceae bacterium]MBR1755916.1 hypothetical protein [Bacteroidaceae bacterium]MBR1791679.1 hypothetical protein [Bacteroidaceae bacterium]